MTTKNGKTFDHHRAAMTEDEKLSANIHVEKADADAEAEHGVTLEFERFRFCWKSGLRLAWGITGLCAGFILTISALIVLLRWLFGGGE